MTDIIIEHYKILVEYLGKIFMPDYEIVLYDLRKHKNCIAAIANGHISGREVGQSINDQLSDIIDKNYKDSQYLVNYKELTKDGNAMRSSTLFIKDQEGTLIGLLCIDFDDSRYIELHDMVLSIAHPFHYLEKYTNHTLRYMDKDEVSENEENIAETQPDIDKLMDVMYHQTISSTNVPFKRMTQEERIRIVGQLKNQGFFKMKGAVPYAAKKLRCSVASVYRYLSEAKNLQE